MATLIPSASSCHTLQLPSTEKDDRLNLIVRTGSSSTLYNSLILTFGGLTIGLDLFDITIQEIQSIFINKIINSNIKFKTFDKYLSGEFFYLKLIDRTWRRVHVDDGPRPKPRLFHEICAINNHAYIFGGLILNDETQELQPCNDLWEFNLQTSTWNLLHDGSGWQDNCIIPEPRFCHKLTEITSLTFVNQCDHFGLFIAGGKNADSQQIFDNYCFDLVDKKYVGQDPFHLKITTGNHTKDIALGLPQINNVNLDHLLSINYINSIIVNVGDDQKTHQHHNQQHLHQNPKSNPELPERPELTSRTASTNSTTKLCSSSHETPGSIIVYAPTTDKNINPLISFKLSKQIKNGKPLPLHKKKVTTKKNTNNSTEIVTSNKNIPYNLRYPTGGLFGQNLVITGFLPNEFDISIFIFNIPTGKWSRLNVFCNHDYGSHRFWGGFAWQSHHKVVLIGNYVTSKTTSSIRFFTTMITVSLPITNILASFELAYGQRSRISSEDKTLTDNLSQIKKPGGITTLSDEKHTTESDSSSSHMVSDEDGDEDDSFLGISNEDVSATNDSPLTRKNTSISTIVEPHNTSISFNEYAHYAAPKTKTSKIRSVFPPIAITLGRNALERYGDLISDFEMVSASGDRIPVSLTILIERWGKYFIRLLAKGYVKAVDKFDLDMSQDKANTRLRTSKSSLGSSSSSKLKSSASTNSASSVSSEGGSSDEQLNKTFTKVRSESVEDLKGYKKDTVASKEKSSFHLSMPIMTNKQQPKDAPQFRLPFQDTPESTLREDKAEPIGISTANHSNAVSLSGSPRKPEGPFISIELHFPPRRGSTNSFNSNHSSLLTSHLQDIPPQLPLPQEQIPAVPTTPISFKSSSRIGSNAGHESPRASLLHTLTVLRNLSVSGSPRDSPFTSPRASVSGQAGTSHRQDYLFPVTGSKFKERAKSIDGSLSEFRNLESVSEDHNRDDLLSKKRNSSSYSSLTTVEGKDMKSSIEPSAPVSSSKPTPFTRVDSYGDEIHYEKESSISFDYPQNAENQFGNLLLNFEGIESGNFRMEASLIPRKLYIPFSTVTLKAFTEYLYTGQVGNKWLLVPTALDNLAIGRFFNVPLLYDLISEVLFGIIGRKEAHIIKEGRKLKKKYLRLQELTHTEVDPNFTFALDRYEGFLDTIDDGYLDIALLKSNSKIHKNSSISTYSSKKRSLGSNYSEKLSFGENSDIRENDLDELKTESSSSQPEIGSEKSSEMLQTPMDTKIDLDSVKLPESNVLHEGENTSAAFGSVSSNIQHNNLDLEVSDSHSFHNEDLEDIHGDPLEDSSDKLTSTSEEENDFGLGFLETRFANTSINPRSKSIFDKSAANIDHATVYEEKEPNDDDALAGLILEQLVSPYAPVPHDAAIDAIYETAAIVTDLKLMLRAANARQMAVTLAQEKKVLGEAIKELKLRYEQQKREVERELSEPHSDLSSMYTEYRRAKSQTSLSNALTSVSSPSDLDTKSKPTGLARLAPFTFTKSKTFGFNEFDKKISKLNKKHEKEKAKIDRVEKAKIEKTAKLEKLKAKKSNEKQSKVEKTNSDKYRKTAGLFELTKSQSVLALNDSASILSNATQTTATTKKQGHGIFHFGYRKKDKVDDSVQDDTSVSSRLTRTISLADSVASDASKHSTSTSNSKSAKGLMGFTKKHL